MRRTIRLTLPATVLAGFLLLGALPLPTTAAEQRVVTVAITGEIGSLLARQVGTQIRMAARDAGTAGILIEIDTPGGELVAAEAIKDAIMGAPVPTAAWVTGHAWSAGALIGLSVDKLYMRPGSSIGAAEPRLLTATGQQPADPKTVSALTGEFRAIAKARGRNPEVAAKMVDKTLKVPGFEDGKLATLDYQQAVEVQIADGIARDRAAVAAAMGWGNVAIGPMETSAVEELALFLTQPWVAILLLLLGVSFIGLEFFTPGTAVPAVVGVIFLALFFGSNLLVGNSPWWVMGMFFAGLVLIAVEAFVPGGVVGVVGLIGVLGAVYLSVPNRSLGLGYMAAVSLGSTVFLVGLIRRVTIKGLPAWLTNAEQQTNIRGFVAPLAQTAAGLVGKRGEATTVLRPAGVAELDGRKVDVVTEGEFLPVGTPVEVLRVEGTRVVVRRAGTEQRG